MAMNKKDLADEIIDNLEASDLYGSGYFSDDADKFIEALADAIIQHITDNSEVTTTITIEDGSSAGDYTGTGSVTD